MAGTKKGRETNKGGKKTGSEESEHEKRREREKKKTKLSKFFMVF